MQMRWGAVLLLQYYYTGPVLAVAAYSSRRGIRHGFFPSMLLLFQQHSSSSRVIYYIEYSKSQPRSNFSSNLGSAPDGPLKVKIRCGFSDSYSSSSEKKNAERISRFGS